jgi:diketogulonate reductase-like aldo/keto reductase
METAVDEGKVRQLGISNFYRLEGVAFAYNNARIKPKVVQNRFYADMM